MTSSRPTVAAASRTATKTMPVSRPATIPCLSIPLPSSFMRRGPHGNEANVYAIFTPNGHSWTNLADEGTCGWNFGELMRAAGREPAVAGPGDGHDRPAGTAGRGPVRTARPAGRCPGRAGHGSAYRR